MSDVASSSWDPDTLLYSNTSNLTTLTSGSEPDVRVAVALQQAAQICRKTDDIMKATGSGGDVNAASLLSNFA